MEFRVLGKTPGGEPYDEVMDGHTRERLHDDLEKAGYEIESIRTLSPPPENPVRSVRPVNLERSVGEDSLFLALLLIGGGLNSMATFAALIAFQEFPAIFIGIFLVIAGFGCWILAAIRSACLAILKALSNPSPRQ